MYLKLKNINFLISMQEYINICSLIRLCLNTVYSVCGECYRTVDVASCIVGQAKSLRRGSATWGVRRG